MENERKEPTIIGVWDGVKYFAESADESADLPFEKYADEVSEGGACRVGYCFNFCPPFARICGNNKTRPKVAWGVAAYLMGHSCTDGRGVVSFFLNDEDVAGSSHTRLFSAYLAAARRVERANKPLFSQCLNPNKRGNIEKIAAKQDAWRAKHLEEEAAALERTRAADHGEAGALWAAVEPIADKYAAWVKGGCTVDDNFLPVVAEVAADEAAPVPVVAETQKRGGKPFSACVVDGTRAAEVTAKLHDLMGAKRGKDACLIVAGAVAAGVIRRPTYEQFREEFGKLAGKSYYNSCQSGFFLDEELAAVVKVFS